MLGSKTGRVPDTLRPPSNLTKTNFLLPELTSSGLPETFLTCLFLSTLPSELWEMKRAK